MARILLFKTYGIALFWFSFSTFGYSQSKERNQMKEFQPDLISTVDTVLSTDFPATLSTFDLKDQGVERVGISQEMQPYLPPLNMQKETIMHYPSDSFWGGYHEWGLHEGFNASLSMGVTCGFGKNRFPGVGFGTSLATMYAKQLTKRFSLAGGVSASHLSWNGRNYNDIGLSVIAGFKLTERVSLYAYGNKSLTGTAYPPCIYPVLSPDKFGGLIHVKVNQSFSFSVGIEERYYP